MRKNHQRHGVDMFYKPLLLPLLAQVLLTFTVWVYLYVRRLLEIRHKGIHPQALQDRSVSQAIFSDSAGPSNNLQNLFEMPLLFYVAVLLSLTLMVQDAMLVRLAWGFVVLRTLHSIVHCSYNRVMHRFVAYAFSCLFLLFIWVRLASYILVN
ncbi:MAG: MAPEG family protein [Xanthomonadales bacterium]|nr:MAPEG family protein [Xanthomonadales bacterium]